LKIFTICISDGGPGLLARALPFADVQWLNVHCPEFWTMERKMKNITSFIAISAFALVMLALPSVASAQWGGRNQNDDYYGNGRYRGNIRGTVENLQNRARSFERQVSRIDDRRDDRYGNRGRYDRFDNLDDLARRLRMQPRTWPTSMAAAAI
jgi:hypothetical protein